MVDEKKFRVNLIEADIPTRKGHVYPKEMLEKAVEEFQEKGLRPVVLDTQRGGKLRMNDVVGKVDLSVEEGALIGDIEFLPTPKGKYARGLMGSGFTKETAVGFGNVREDGVVENYRINSVALVAGDPSVPSEGVIYKPDELDLDDDQWEWGYRDGQLVRVVNDGVDVKKKEK